MERLTSKLKIKRFQTLKATKQDTILAEIAVQCLCELLTEHPYFNFNTNIAQLLVAFLNIQNETIRTLVYNSFTRIFKTDKRLDLTRHVSISNKFFILFENNIYFLIRLFVTLTT